MNAVVEAHEYMEELVRNARDPKQARESVESNFLNAYRWFALMFGMPTKRMAPYDEPKTPYAIGYITGFCAVRFEPFKNQRTIKAFILVMLENIYGLDNALALNAHDFSTDREFLGGKLDGAEEAQKLIDSGNKYTPSKLVRYIQAYLASN